MLFLSNSKGGGLFRFRAAAIAVLLLVLAAALVPAADDPKPSESANDLIRRVVANELKADAERPPYTYLTRRETPRGSRTARRVTTKEGTIGITVAVNDKPLSRSEIAEQDRALVRAISDPDWRRKMLRDQQDEMVHRRNVLQAMPDGFVYEFDGKEEDGLLRLTFRPNPSFTPKSREAQVFYGMQGRVWVDPASERFSRVEATLFRDVDFGWGFFGHLDRGGTITLLQTRLEDANWQPTALDVHLTGKILLFKSLNVKQDVTFSGYRPAPKDMTLAEGLDFLRKADGAAEPAK